MRCVQYVVDAFTDRVFRGNPAAVVLLRTALPDTLLQAIAAENNLSETAFARREGDRWRLRWFTPKTEVTLCGHGTLATAATLADLGHGPDADGAWRFETASGPLWVTRDAGGRFMLDFPAWAATPATAPDGLAEALGAVPLEVHRARDWICVFGSAAEVEALAPDHARIATLPGDRVIATAAGGEGVDITSRYFAAKVGVNEDPVTGAAHTQLVPFWAARLRRTALVCRQASRRGGTLWTEHVGDRVRMAGDAAIFCRGEIVLPEIGAERT